MSDENVSHHLRHQNPHQHHLPHHLHHHPHHSAHSTNGTSIASDTNVNTDYLKTISGLLNFIQLFLGSVAIMIILNNYPDSESKLLRNQYQIYDFMPIVLLLNVSTTFFICTCCLLLSSILSTGAKTLYEFVYNLIAALFLFGASTMLFVIMWDEEFTFVSHKGAAIICFLNSLFYLANAANSQYVSTLLKLAQLTIGCICVGLIVYFFKPNRPFILPNLFFLLMITTFTIGTFCILIFDLFSTIQNDSDSKTIYELVYHLVAAILIFVSSLYMLVKIQHFKDISKSNDYFNFKAHMTAGILAVFNALLYAGSAAIAQLTCRAT